MRGLILSVLFVFATPALADEVALDFSEEAQATNEEYFGHYKELLNAGKITEREYEMLVLSQVIVARMKAYKSPNLVKHRESSESKKTRWERLHSEGKITDREHQLLINSQKLLDN